MDDDDRTPRPAPRASILAEAFEAFVHTGGYICYVLAFKSISSAPEKQPQDEHSSLHDLQLDYGVPLFNSMNVALHTFVFVSLWLFVVGDKAVAKVIDVGDLGGDKAGSSLTKNGTGAEGGGSSLMQKLERNTFFGVPAGFLLVNVSLNVLSGLSFLQALVYLPASVAESIMQTGPAASILITSVLQPHLKYNRYAWLSVVPIVAGGVMVAMADSSGRGVRWQATRGNKEEQTQYIVGIVWSVVALLTRCLRIIVVDLVVGTYEDSLAPLAGSEPGAEGEGTPEVTHGDGEIERLLSATTISRQHTAQSITRGSSGAAPTNSTPIQGTAQPQLPPAPEMGEPEPFPEMSPEGSPAANSPVTGSPTSPTDNGNLKIKKEHPPRSLPPPPALPVAFGGRALRLPTALELLRVMMPVNACIYLAASLCIERDTSGWMPASRAEALSQQPKTIFGHPTNGEVVLVLALVFIGVSAFLWLLTEFRLVEDCGSYTVAILANLNRTGAVVAAVAVLGEKFSSLQVVGLLLVIGGVALKLSLGQAYLVGSASRDPGTGDNHFLEGTSAADGKKYSKGTTGTYESSELRIREVDHEDEAAAMVSYGALAGDSSSDSAILPGLKSPPAKTR